MRISCVLFGCGLLATIAVASPIVKREAASEDLSPLNEVYIVETDSDQAVDDERTDRDKRKIGVVKLGVSNGILNFVFGKLDSFIDSKTKALTVLDESNKAKNAAFGIDPHHSATSKFISELIASKIQAASGSIGPVVNSASTFLTSAKTGLAGAFASKLAPLSSIATGVAAGTAGKLDGSLAVGPDSGHGGGSSAGLLGSILSSKLSSLSSLSQSSGGGHSDSGTNDASAGINLGAFANLGGGHPKVIPPHYQSLATDFLNTLYTRLPKLARSWTHKNRLRQCVGYAAAISVGSIANPFSIEEKIVSTTEDIPEFDRKRVSLDVPSSAFGTGFNLVTNVSKILNSLILNSARRTQTVLEIFKPFFRGAFAIKGLPSDNPH